MKILVRYTVDVNDVILRGVAIYYGEPGLASEESVVNYCQDNGEDALFDTLEEICGLCGLLPRNCLLSGCRGEDPSA